MNKYALLAETDVSGIFEVFETIVFSEAFADTNGSWSSGVASGDPFIMHVSGVDSVSVGDSIVDGEFVSNGGERTAFLFDNVEVFLMVSNSTVFGFISVEKDSFMAQKIMAAVSGNTLVIDATNNSDVVLGALWDGTNVVSN